MVVRPLNNRIVAKAVEVEKKSGLLLVNEKINRQILEVVSVCDGQEEVKPGDRIVVDKYGPVEREIDGEKIYIIDMGLVLGVFE